MHNAFIASRVDRGDESWKVRLFNRLLGRLGKQARLVTPLCGLASVEWRINVFHLAEGILEFGVPGDFVELGCHDGESSCLLQRVLLEHDPSRKLHVFDSFQGTPEPSDHDEGVYQRGDMRASQAQFEAQFAAVNLPLPMVHAGWFEETLPDGLPDQISFALIDADLYASTRLALEYVYPRLAPRGVGVLGVYYDPVVYHPRSELAVYRSPGVKKACDEFFGPKREAVSVLYAGDYTMGVFRKI